MRIDFEERILRNPAFGAVLTWRFARSYFEVDGRAPSLAHLTLAMPLALHRPTVRKVHRMNFASGLIHAVASSVDITSELQERTQQTMPIVLQSLAVAAASELVVVQRNGRALLEIRPKRLGLIRALEPTEDSTSDMVDAIRLTFLVIDQPGQVYFPSDTYTTKVERSADTASATHEDFARIIQIFETLDHAARFFGLHLQIIVLEHADQKAWGHLESHVEVGNWRDADWLIPRSWLPGKPDKAPTPE